MSRIIIVGAGGQGREALELCTTLGRKVTAFCEESPAADKMVKGLPVWDVNALSTKETDDHEIILAVGSPALKARLERKVAGLPFATLVHPRAVVGPDVNVGEGSMICAGAVLTTDIEIGRHVMINVACSVSHDCVIEDYVTCSPNSALSGNVRVGEGSFVGAGATLIEKVRLGGGCVVAAGALVNRDVPHGVMVAGVPAQVKKTLAGWH